MSSPGELDAVVAPCRACPRLVAWREEVARVGRRAFRDGKHCARPVPGFGPADALPVLVGPAPAGHGGNRTGQIFTGAPSGDVLHRGAVIAGLPLERHP